MTTEPNNLYGTSEAIRRATTITKSRVYKVTLDFGYGGLDPYEQNAFEKELAANRVQRWTFDGTTLKIEVEVEAATATDAVDAAQVKIFRLLDTQARERITAVQAESRSAP